MSLPTLFDYESEAFVRSDDPRPAKDAAASNRAEKARQRRIIVAHLATVEKACADDLGPLIHAHRSVASTRLNVLRRKGHAEKCGTYPAADDDGRVRDVEHWRITEDGRKWLAALTPEGRHYLEERAG